MESLSFKSLLRSNKMQLNTFVIAVTIIAAALPVKSSPVTTYDASYYPPPPPPPVYNQPNVTTTPSPAAAYPPSDGYQEVYQMQHPGYYNTPSEEYSQPPAYNNNPSPNYQSQGPYTPQENYYSATPQATYPTPAPVNYNPPQNNYYQPPPPVYNPPPQNNYYQSPPPEVYNPPQPIYYSPPQENYRPSYAPSPYYSPPQYYKEKPKYEVEKVSYEAVTYRELNESINCGVFAAVNAELYKDAYNRKNVDSTNQYGTALLEKDDVGPFGLCPWAVRITDDYNNYICGATIVQNRQILTLASCIQGRSLENLRVRYGDWDLLNDVNEYEAYKNYETRICRTLPVTCPSTYGYPDSVGQLIILQVDFIEDYDKYPQTKPICLPEWPYNPPAYSPPPPPPTYYAPPAPVYNQPQGYNVPQVYSPPAISYSPPPTYQEPDVYTECWVEGYYSSPITELKNHQPPKPVSDNYYSYPAKDYNPYGANYYAEKSKLPRRAQVKRIEQPYQQQPPQYGYKSAPQCDEEQQWVGVNGYDACVADVGTAIICIVPEDEKYETGYENNEAYYDGPPQYKQPPQYDNYVPYKEIKAAPSPDKVSRKRAVIVAVVKTTTDCTVYEEKSQYDPRVSQENVYDGQQSRPITAVKVTSAVVDTILDKFWEGSLDESCPVPKSSYPEPNYYPETIKPKVYKPEPSEYSVSPYYAPQPAPEPIYSRPPQYPLRPLPPQSYQPYQQRPSYRRP